MAKSETPKKQKPVTPVQQALRITWLLNGKLKCLQIAHLKVGELLAQVRDEKLYAKLKHPDMESYAEARLRLGRASLYRYLQVYDWVLENHEEWLQPKPKGYIPNIHENLDLIFIDDQLKRKNLSKESRSELEAMEKKALDGRLTEKELDAWKKKGRRTKSGLKPFLSRMKSMRLQGSQLDEMPAEAITHIDAAIEIIRNAVALQPPK